MRKWNNKSDEEIEAYRAARRADAAIFRRRADQAEQDAAEADAEMQRRRVAGRSSEPAAREENP